MELGIPVNAPHAQGNPVNAGPHDEAPQHFLIQQQQFPAVPHVNENDAQNNGPVLLANGGIHDEVPANGADIPPPPPLPMPLPHVGQHNPQHAQASGPLNRLKAAARYVKRKLTRHHHGNHNHGNPMYNPGAPREERAPLGLEEAPPLPGGHVIHNNGERRARWFAACFGFLFRRRGGAAVQEYPLQGEEAAAFEEAAEMEPEIDDDELVEEEVGADEEPFEALEGFQQQNIVLIF